MCSAPNVYMFVYILIGAAIVPLRDINEQAVINSLDSNLPFYITHILEIMKLSFN